MKIIEQTTSERKSFVLETVWIKFFREKKFFLYNATNGGIGTIGFKHSNKTKKKMSKTRAGKYPDCWTGKTVKGSAHYAAKLTERDVRKIKKLLLLGHSGAEIARKFGVIRRTISAIKTGKNWSHVKI